MARAIPNVFSIAPGFDFARVFVEALLERHLVPVDYRADPFRLADLTLHVPNQRARVLFEQAFAEAFAPGAVILPRIRPLAEPGDPVEKLAGESLVSAESELMLAAARPIPDVLRRFKLLPIVERWRDVVRARPEGTGEAAMREALALAAALGRLIDEMRISGVPLATLASAAPSGYDAAQFDQYWVHSRDFLRIAAEYWPAELAEIGARDEADLRIAGIEAEASRLEGAPDEAVIVAGSTGSVAATARLMRSVSRLERGAVILPGLDHDLASAVWDLVGDREASLATRFAHPQAVLKATLATIGTTREAVTPLGAEPAAQAARNRLIAESLRPAETVDGWRETMAEFEWDAALDGLSVIEAEDEREEGLAIAVAIRQALETPDRRIALVTADRGLARRVCAELTRWSIEATDSAGTRLVETSAGGLLALFLRAAARGDDVSLLAFLRHPALRAGMSAAAFRARVDALELLVMRGRFFLPETRLPERVRHALANPPFRPHPANERIDPECRADLHRFAGLVADALAPFAGDAPTRNLDAFAADLRLILDDLCRDEAGASSLDGAPDAAMLFDLLAEIVAHGGNCRLAPEALAGVLDTFAAERVLPPTFDGHPRVVILGPLEARLVPADLLVLGGMSEGSFPPVAEDDPFLNRSMRLDLGLQAPERRIGQSAHDFAMMTGHAEIILTRARRSGQQPALPSRFLRRLEACIGEARWKALRERGEATLRLARALDQPEAYRPLGPPSVIPNAPRVPEKLTITEIETLRRDPYAIYARHILRLRPLEPLSPEIDNRERGTLLHACLEEYAGREPPRDPEEAMQRLREIGTRHFAPIRHETEIFQFWWRHFLRIIPGFVAFDRRQRDAGRRVLTELRAETEIRLPGGETVRISGKADRLEIDAAGGIEIFDYKSGMSPTKPMIDAGLAPQLPITAALVLGGAFTGIPPRQAVLGFAYVPIGGEDVEPKQAQATESATALARENWARLEKDLTAYASGERAYLSRVAPADRNREGEYDHLARVREWALGLGEDDGEGEE